MIFKNLEILNIRNTFLSLLKNKKTYINNIIYNYCLFFGNEIYHDLNKKLYSNNACYFFSKEFSEIFEDIDNIFKYNKFFIFGLNGTGNSTSSIKFSLNMANLNKNKNVYLYTNNNCKDINYKFSNFKILESIDYTLNNRSFIQKNNIHIFDSIDTAQNLSHIKFLFNITPFFFSLNLTDIHLLDYIVISKIDYIIRCPIKTSIFMICIHKFFKKKILFMSGSPFIDNRIFSMNIDLKKKFLSLKNYNYNDFTNYDKFISFIYKAKNLLETNKDINFDKISHNKSVESNFIENLNNIPIKQFILNTYYIINSLKNIERYNPNIISQNRIIQISRGSGVKLDMVRFIINKIVKLKELW